MRIIKFEPEHLDMAVLQEPERRMPELRHAYFLADHISGTFIEDGKIIAFAGIVLLPNKVGEVWVLPAENIKQGGMAFARWLKRYIPALARLYGLKNIRTGCENIKRRRRFLEWLGFTNHKNIYVREF